MIRMIGYRKAAMRLCALWVVTALFLLSGTGRMQALASDNSQLILEDQADLLSESEETDILRQAQQIASKTKWDVRILTTDDTNGRSARDYAEDYYMDNYHSDDGFACLIDMDNREIYIATSGETIYYLTDDRREALLDNAYEYVSDGDYAGTFESMLTDMQKYYDQGVESDAYTYNEDTGEYVEYKRPKQFTLFKTLLAALAGLVGSLGMGGIVSKQYKQKGKPVRYSVRDNGSLSLAVKQDRLVNRFVTTRHIPKSPPPSSGGGGFSGGHQSSIHIGSGGHSFGGGGRKF